MGDFSLATTLVVIHYSLEELKKDGILVVVGVIPHNYLIPDSYLPRVGTVKPMPEGACLIALLRRIRVQDFFPRPRAVPVDLSDTSLRLWPTLASLQAPTSAYFVQPPFDCDGKGMEKTRQPLLPWQKGKASQSDLQIHCRVYRIGPCLGPHN